MNGAQGHMASEPCERVLDYAYGELEGEALEQFKLHLLTCEKCKAELAALERVRAAVKQAMPVVEPPAERMNAMTAQLLHAAAQNKPQQGKLLQFARKARVVVSHPAYLAAASLILIGGAIGLQWSLGRLTMPAEKMPAASETAAAAPAPQAEPAAPPAAAPEFELKSKEKEGMKLVEKKDESQVFLDGVPTGKLAVKSAPAKAKRSASRDDDMNGLAPKFGFEGDSLLDPAARRSSSGSGSGAARGPIGGKPAREQPLAKELAKPEPPAKSPAEDRKANKQEAADEEASIVAETTVQATRSRTVVDPKGRPAPPPVAAPPPSAAQAAPAPRAAPASQAAPAPQAAPALKAPSAPAAPQAAAPPPPPVSSGAHSVTVSTPGYQS